MTDRDAFLARMTSEISRQNAALAKKREDEVMAGQRVEEVIGRLRGIILDYNDWLKNNGLFVENTSTSNNLTVSISDQGKQPFKINFSLGSEGTFYLGVEEPSDVYSMTISLDDPMQVSVSDWNDHLFEREMQRVIAEVVKRREAVTS